MSYGNEVILDLHDCNVSKFNREDITTFFNELCDRIDMQPEDLHFWDDLNTPEGEEETEPHLVGTSAIQFIKTSNITIHTLDLLKRVYLNIFSCKPYDSSAVIEYCLEFFGGRVVKEEEIERL